ncbi:MAG TPA: NUDIX domain-containing protein [Ktedonobacterales bacterium]|nr:NUDIX domain-containing protein [Ktedonobacterales bacterium]
MVNIARDSGLRRLALRLFRRTPPKARGWLIRRIAPKVTMGVCAVVLDGRGRILVARHTYRRWPWGLPGGLIERDEAPMVALARELREECATDATIGPLLHAELFRRHLTLYYQASLASDPQPDGVEIAGFEYVAPDDIVRVLGRAALPWLAQLALLTPTPPSTLATAS